MREWMLVAFLGIAAGALAGCHNNQPFVSEQRLQRGLVIVLTGIEGRSRLNEGICRGLDAGGVEGAIELTDWTSPIPGNFVYNLRAEGRNRDKAREIADRITRYQMVYPHRPVVLVGHSGGGAIAAWVAEAMPLARKIDGIVMLAPALSPGYMLDQALLNCRQGIVNFHSPRDVVLLGVGTTVAGTMDGEHTSSAGRVGFDLPDSEYRSKAYGKLFQIAWNEKMTETGNIGIHLSSVAERFVAAYVAPLVRAERWNQELIARVVNRESVEPEAPGRALEWDAFSREAGRARTPTTRGAAISPSETPAAARSTKKARREASRPPIAPPVP